MSTDDVIARLADTNHGVVTRRELLTQGVGTDAIDRRLRRRVLHPKYPGIYAVGRSELSVDGQRLAAVWACGQSSWLSYASAGVFHKIYRERKPGWDVSIHRGYGGRRGSGLIRLHHLRTLHTDDVTVRRGVPVTTLARTLVDLAWILSPDDLERAVHEAEVSRQLNVAAVESVIARMPSRHGVAELQTVLGTSASEPTNSEFIRLFLRLCSDYGLPIPKASVYLDVGLPSLKETDLLFRDALVIVELDGAAVHMSRRNFESDRRRDVAFLACGYATVRVTWRRLTREPEALASELRAILAQRSPEARVGSS